jgi:transporter family protein
MWWIYALLAALFAALTAIFAKIGLRDINSDLATAIRTVVILLVAWGVAFFRGEVRGMNLISKEGLVFLILSGIATGLSWLFYFKALQLGRVSQVAPVDKLSLALVIILSVAFLGEPLTWKMLLGALLIIGGTVVLIL